MNKTNTTSTREKDKAEAVNKLRKNKDKIKNESQLLAQKYTTQNKKPAE